MQEHISHEHLPPDEGSPEFVHAVPEVHYSPELNVATELLDRHVAAGRGENVAIYFEDERITYTELQRRVDRLGNALLDLGVAPGDRVLVRFSNRPEAIVSCLAVQKIGAVALPSMKLLRAKELTYIANDAEVAVAIVLDDLFDELDAALSDLDSLKEVIVVDRTEGVYDDHAFQDYDNLLAAADEELAAHDTDRDDLALMLYTSGTTGRSKGAVHTHRQVLATADTYAKYCLSPTEEDVFGGNPPLPFAYGYGDLVTFPLRFGASTSLVEDATPETLLDAIERHGISIFCSIPTAFNQILSNHPDGPAEFDTSSLRLGVSAGEPLTPTTYERFEAEYGVPILDGIGTTEMLHIFVSHRSDDEIDPAATGYPVPGYECQVIDPDSGGEVPRGTAGLLAVRGPTGMTYWDRPDEQEAVLREGWSLPGDIFVHREDGRFEYKSRRDDLIVTSGYNVPGPEVEGVLEGHDAVAEVAVVESPDEERGQIVKAYVVPVPEADPDNDLASELQDLVKNTLAPYKYPRAIEFVEELPRTETGKIQRLKLRERERERQAQA
jgi:2-aminobenzoate-CoA ligase